MAFTLNTVFKNYKEEKIGIKYYGWRIFAIVLAYFVIGAVLAVYADNFATKHAISEENNWFRIVNNLVTTGFTLLLFLFGAKYLLKHSYNSLGFSFKRFFKEYPKGILIGFAMFSLCVLIGVMVGEQTLTYNSQPFSWLMWFSFFGLFFVQGMSEEVIFRSFALSEISSKWGLIVGLIASNILFALFHAMNGGAFGLEGGIICSIGLIISGIAFLYVYKNKSFVNEK